jgi:hypothetical protein
MNDVVQNIIHFVITFLFAVFFLMSGVAARLVSRKVQAFMQDRWVRCIIGRGDCQPIPRPDELLLGNTSLHLSSLPLSCCRSRPI